MKLKLLSTAAIAAALLSCDQKTEETCKLEFSAETRALTAYVINENAELPSIPTKATVVLEQGDRVLWLKATYKMEYKDHGRNDLQQWEQDIPAVPNPAWNIRFQQVIGGRLTVCGRGQVRTRQGRTIPVQCGEPWVISVKGTNPAKEKIRAFTNHKELSAVIYFHSQFRQFDASGLPLFNNGFGLYKMANPNAEQVWSWKKNAEAAIADFNARKEAARKIPAQLRQQNPDEYRNLPDFTEDQLTRETLQSYGTGRYHEPKKNVLGRWRWLALKENDGFAKKCEEVLKAVAANQPPQGWN